MGLWRTRHHSEEMLEKDFKAQARVIEKAFDIVDECIDLFDQRAADDDYHRVCGLVLAKARNYALGVYSLILDGLGQEAGALLRLLIECHELLTYFRLDPNRISKAINNNLPKAGKRAQSINGHFKELRDHLNENASHSSFSYHALNHLLDKPEMRIRKEQPMLPVVLFRNTRNFFLQFLLMSIEATECLQAAEMRSADKQAAAIDALRLEAISVFKLDERVLANT